MRCVQQQRRVLIAAIALVVGAAGFSGCKIAEVKRQDEIGKFDKYLKDQNKRLAPQTAQVLSMWQCEQIAVANSLDLLLRQMALKIADDRVRLAMTGWLPNGSLNYADTTRSNANLINQGGQTFPAGDRHTQGLGVQATMPILDWGITYYSYTIAKDSRKQEDLLLLKAVQLLIRDIRIAYVRHAGAVRREALLSQALQAAVEVQRIARSLERAGETVRSDTALVDASVAQAELDLAITQKEVRETKLTLSQLMSLPPSVDFHIEYGLPKAPDLPNAEGVERMADRALVARPELAVQDLTQHITANEARKQFANFFPRVDGIGGFNWASGSQLVNSNWFWGGIQVSSGLLDGGADIFKYSIAKQQNEIEKERSLLLSLGVIYEVEMGALQVKQNYEVVKAAASLEYARQAAMTQVISLYNAGIQDPAGAARALADFTIQSTALDRAQQAYLVSWHELEAIVLPERPFVAMSATTQPWHDPSTQPSVPSATVPVTNPATTQRVTN